MNLLLNTMKSAVTLILGLVATVHALDCSNPQCDKGSAVTPNTCVTHENGAGMSWIEMADQCITLGGRLLSLPSNNSDVPLQNFYKNSSLIKNITRTTDSVVLGVMSSIRDDDGKVFLYEHNLLNSTDCSNIDTKSSPCVPPSLSPDQKKCESIGCCWKNAGCSYPRQPMILQFSTFLIPGPLNSIPGRGCVYMEKQNGSFSQPKWTEKDCFTPSVNTEFICEFACSGSFPSRPTIIPTLPNPTGKSSVATVTKPGSTVHGNVTGSTSRNGAKNSRNRGSRLRVLDMVLILLALGSFGAKNVVTGH